MSQTTNNLQISVEEPAAWSRKLVITVPSTRVKSERTKVARQLAKRVRLPGFRKGKIPLERMEARFGPDIDRHTKQQVIDAAFREAVKIKELEPISEPRVANVSYDRDSELTFEVAFDIRPEITLGRVGGFRLTQEEVTVSDEEVAERLEAVRRQQALWRPVERKPAAGDSVEVEITPLGESEASESEPRQYRFTLGEGQAIVDVEAAITTLGPGETGEFEVTFPDDFPDEEQRGTKQHLRVDLKQVFEQELPELNDEFAGSLGDFEDLEALRGAIRDDIAALKQREADQEVNRQLIEQIIDANPFQVPETMVTRYVAALLGPPPEGANPDLVSKAEEEARPMAEWGIKRQMIIQRIAEDQGLEATREELQERVQGIATHTGRPVQQVRARLSKSGELREMERAIVEEKVFEYLREQSDIKVGE
ncbi:MAG: trigger factor [Gemmatimonadales bacterium]